MVGVRRGDTVVVLLGYPPHPERVTVREVYPDMAIGGDVFTAAIPDGQLLTLSEDEIISRS
jgi:hypothetical protein